jgi:transposase-like protein
MTAAGTIKSPDELLRLVSARAEAGEPLTVRKLMAFPAPLVARLFDEALIERKETRLGVVVVPSAAAKYQPEAGQRAAPRPDAAPAGAWSHEQLEYFRRAYPAGAPYREMIHVLGKTADDVLRAAWTMKLDRPRLGRPWRSRRARNAHGGVFEVVAPAWRIRRFRLMLEEAWARGGNPRDGGEGLDHRALRSAFARGRSAAQAAGAFKKSGRYLPDEAAGLRELFKRGRSPKQIAATLGRELTGVYKKLRELGLYLPDDRWSSDEDARLISGLQTGLTAKEMTHFLPGRSRQAIKNRGYALWPGRGADMWTEAESARLAEAYAKGENIKKVALELGRGVCGCRWRARYLGLVHPNAVREYTPAEDRIIRAGFKAGRRVSEIADELGRETAGIYNRAFKLGVKHRNMRPWTDADLARLKHLAESGVPGPVAAAALDREVHAVYKCAAKRGFHFRAKKNGRRKPKPVDPRYGQRRRGAEGDGGWRARASEGVAA